MGPDWLHLEASDKKKRLRQLKWKQKVSVEDARRQSSQSFTGERFLKPEPKPFRKKPNRRALDRNKKKIRV